MKYEKEIKKYIGTAKYDEHGSYIWGVNKKEELEMVGQIKKIPKERIEVNKVLSVIGWGAIQNMFKNIDDAADFQDELGQFITDAINEKIQRESNDNDWNHINKDLKMR